MPAFDFRISERPTGQVIIDCSGYYDEEAGKKIQEALNPFLARGRVLIALNLGRCGTVNSLGIASILDLAMQVIDDFKGKLVVTGLDPLKKSVFEVTGVFPLAEYAGTIDEALAKLT